MSTKFQQTNGKEVDIKEIIKQYQKSPHDEELQTDIVNHYKNLVYSLARKFSKNKDYEEDLYQVGMIGLLAAMKRFDPDYGKSFESFAIPTVVGEIKRYIRDKTWSVHVPRRIKELGPKIKQAVETLTSEQQRSPTVPEIAAHLEVNEEDVLETMELGKSYQAVSVDNEMQADQEGGKVSLLDLIGQTDKSYKQVNEKMTLEKAFKVLNEREREILRLTYFENKSQREVGDKLDISQMHVSRLQRKALRKLRGTLSEEERFETNP